jgi:hypothetical protein
MVMLSEPVPALRPGGSHFRSQGAILQMVTGVGSNQRGLGRRFYSPSFQAESPAADQRRCGSGPDRRWEPLADRYIRFPVCDLLFKAVAL